jgi:hypothetical protein
MITPEQESLLNSAIGHHAGIAFRFEEGDVHPWRIEDDQIGECFYSFDELLAAAHSWRKCLDAEADQGASHE